jgi:2-keto-3-deoxy-L-rhamnonate aldolase RhmA
MKPKFVTRQVGNELILVPLSDNVAQMSELFTLNETGRFIWENINEKTTVEVMEGLMTEAFIIDRETAKKDIENFLKQLETAFQ